MTEKSFKHRKHRPGGRPHFVLILLRMAAEFLASGIMVALGGLGCRLALHNSSAPELQCCLHYTAVYTGILLCFGQTSEPRMNPNQTMAEWYMKRIATVEMIANVMGQFAGAFVGFYLLEQMCPKTLVANEMALPYTMNLSMEKVFLIEFLLTSLLLLRMDGRRRDRCLTSGSMALLMGIVNFIDIHTTGGSLNPAVSLMFSLYYRQPLGQNARAIYLGQALATLLMPIVQKLLRNAKVPFKNN